MISSHSTHDTSPIKRILLVDDDVDTQFLLTHVFETAGFNVSSANDGKDCVEKAMSALEEEQPFDLVLMDIQMPHMNGHEATRELRSRGYALPIVALTARSANSDKERCFDSGCNAFISKLQGKSSLVGTVKEHLERAEEAETIELPVLPIVPEAIYENPSCAPRILSFLDTLPHALSRIKNAFAAEDFETISQTTFELGAASFYGYTIFTDYLQDIQEACSISNANTIRRLLPQVERTVEAMLAGRRTVEKYI